MKTDLLDLILATPDKQSKKQPAKKHVLWGDPAKIKIGKLGLMIIREACRD